MVGSTFPLICISILFLVQVESTVVSSSVENPVTCQSTAVEGISWTYEAEEDSVIVDINSLEKCASICQDDGKCRGYTWQHEGPLSICYTFVEVRGQEACKSCISGIPNIPLPGGGACAGDFDHILAEANADTAAECVNKCENTEGCIYITWFNASSIFANTCFMFNTCDDVRPCDDCESWQISCVPGEECFGDDYYNMDDRSRSVTNGNGSFCDRFDDINRSPDWKGPGFYSITGFAGSGIADKAPGYAQCDTELSGYISGKLF